VSFYYFFGERFFLKISGNDLILIRQNNELIDKAENNNNQRRDNRI